MLILNRKTPGKIRAQKGEDIRSVNSARLERWLGAEKIAHISNSIKGWYGPPIHLLDVPGSVRVTSDGDFIGPFEYGYIDSAVDAFDQYFRRLWREMGRVDMAQCNAGFTSISDALARASSGYSQYPGGGQ